MAPSPEDYESLFRKACDADVEAFATGPKPLNDTTRLSRDAALMAEQNSMGMIGMYARKVELELHSIIKRLDLRIGTVDDPDSATAYCLMAGECKAQCDALVSLVESGKDTVAVFKMSGIHAREALRRAKWLRRNLYSGEV
jgi:hypothetical protein